jgi:dynactin 1
MKAGGGGILRSTSGESSTSSTKASPESKSGRARTDVSTAKTQGRRGSLAVLGAAASSTRTSPSRTPNPVAGELAAALRELDDLRAKIKFLEKKRQEDRDKLKVLERVQYDRDRFEGIIQTLQVKYKPQDAELKELKKQFKEMEKLVADVEDVKAEHEAVLEMATLDREMAEEQAEAYKSELEAVRAKAEELEMEAEILREENDELGQGMTQEEKTSKGFLQMEKQNERLKDALLRLREITTQTEEELRATNASLEEEVNDLTKYKDEHEAIKQKLIANESAVEDLRNQLEAVLGAEEMLEELTERNMNMSEQIDEYRATMEDLESLKEISDELEINHIETEKQMQEDIDYREIIIGEQTKRIQQLDASTEEAEYTITRFRELVVNLQSDLEDMRASQQLTEAEAGELSARSRSMMDLNMKLQITAAKTQNKTIDLELRKLEADEAMEHLAIVQMFLPDSFHNERDSVLALLRFKRVAFKAHLLLTFVKERLQSSQLQSGHEDQLIAACDMCDKLTWVSAMCQRFVHCISSCSVAQFSRFEGALYELDPVERALNSWIEGLRRDELNEKHCVSELHRTMALMSHLGEIHLSNDLGGFASDLHMRVLLMQSYMESTAAATSLLKLAVQQKLTVSTPEDQEAAANFHKKSDAVISQSRNIKVIIAKILRSLDEFHTRNLSLTANKLQLFADVEDATRRLADYTRALAEVVYTLLFSNEPEEQNRAVSWGELQTSLLATTERILIADETDIFGVCTRELKSLTSTLADLAAVASDIDSTAEFERSPAPWTTLSQTLKTTTTVPPDTEDELRRLRDSLLESRTHLKLRIQAHDEASVKIELLESRMRNVAKQTRASKNWKAAWRRGC